MDGWIGRSTPYIYYMHIYVTFCHFSDDMIIFLPKRSRKLPKTRTMTYTPLYPTKTSDP